MWQHMFCVSVMCAVWRREHINDDARLKSHQISNRNFANCWLWTQVSANVKWLVFIDTAADIDHVFRDFDIPFDYEFLVAQQEGQVSLTEVYRLDQHHPLQKYRLGTWSSEGGFVWTATLFTTRRGDLQGYPITGAAYPQVSWYRRKISQGACVSVC